MDDRYLNLTRHGVLAVPGSLWAILIFLSRNWVALLAALAMMRHTPEVIRSLQHPAFGLVLLLQSPLLLLVYAGSARLPGAGWVPRWAWRHGVAIVSMTVLVNMAAAAYFLANQATWAPWPERAVLAAALIDGALGVMVWRSPYYRQIFSEFPTVQPSGQTG